MSGRQAGRWANWALTLAVGLAWADLALGQSPGAEGHVEASAPRAEAGSATIRLRHGDGGPARIELSGLTDETLAAFGNPLEPRQASRFFRVQVASQAAASPPMLGSYVIEKGAIEGAAVVFTPRFPLLPGVEYRASFDPSESPSAEPAGGRPLSIILKLPKKPAGPPPRVTAVYPTSDVLPENLLKFYLHFSAPMRRGESYQNLRLVNERGDTVADPFLELPEELWDPMGRRFTLLLDPGRIKRGLKPREEAGPVLVEGGRYELIVDRRWRDAAGHGLERDVRKSFRVGPPDDRQPDPRRWQVTPPLAGSRESLVVDFGEPLDHALLQRAIAVTTDAGASVEGSVRIDERERRWTFTPNEQWRAGHYVLEIDETLEDLAGNSVGRPFEVDQSGTVGEPPAGPKRLPFSVTAAQRP